MINALRFTEELEKAGFTAEQAKKSVDTWMSLMNDNFATKSDLRELQLINKSEFKDVRTDIRESSSSLKAEIKDFKTSLSLEIRDVEKALVKKIDDQFIKLGLLILATLGTSTAILGFMISNKL